MQKNSGGGDNKVGAFKIAFMLVGSMVGAGFASGREIWVYFGSFGNKGYLGLVILFLLYLLSTFLSTELAYKLRSGRYEDVITPKGHEKLSHFIKYFFLGCVWVVIMSMSAAGGSVASEMFGIHKSIGGLVVVVLVLATVLGNFHRVSNVIGYIMPVLMATLIFSCIYLQLSDIPDPGYTTVPQHGSLTPTWYISAFVYMCFSLTGILSITVSCAVESKDKKSMYGGIIMAASFITLLAGLMIKVVTIYPSFTEALSLPIPGYTSLVSPVLYRVFTVALMCSIYAAATTGYYSFTTALKQDKYKKYKVIGFALLGYFLGLMGFKNVVNYVFSIKGIVSVIIWILLIRHYVCEFIIKKEGKEGTD